MAANVVLYIIVALSVLRLARSKDEIDFVESSINNVNNYENRVLRPLIDLLDPKTVTLKDPPSIKILSGTHFRVDGWDIKGGFYIIKIIQPKDECNYSVTITSLNKYTGVGKLQSRDELMVVYTWTPLFPLDDYEIIVHEMIPGHEVGHTRGKPPTTVLPPGWLPIPVTEQQLLENRQHASLLLKNLSMEVPPCSTKKRMHPFDGTWVGPELEQYLNLNIGGINWLRNGWGFLPSLEMNCQIETFSTDDLLSIPPGHDGKEKSIMVIGTSIMRGVFLSLTDLLLPDHDKYAFGGSVINKCWGRVQVKKGNLRLMYQDFRVGEFEEPGEVGTDILECHNNLIVKEGSEYLHNAYRIWEEIFHDETKWPDVIFLLSGYGVFSKKNNFDFESHTLYFARTLPPSWSGTLILTDGMFSGAVIEHSIGQFTDYRSNIRKMLAKINDSRVRWIDGAGISKEMKLYTESGPEYVAGSVHFHRRCPHNHDTFKSIKVCSNITELVAQMLLGHALGLKQDFQEQVLQSKSRMISKNHVLETCSACPRGKSKLCHLYAIFFYCHCSQNKLSNIN